MTEGMAKSGPRLLILGTTGHIFPIGSGLREIHMQSNLSERLDL